MIQIFTYFLGINRQNLIHYIFKIVHYIFWTSSVCILELRNSSIKLGKSTIVYLLLSVPLPPSSSFSFSHSLTESRVLDNNKTANV